MTKKIFELKKKKLVLPRHMTTYIFIYVHNILMEA